MRGMDRRGGGKEGREGGEGGQGREVVVPAVLSLVVFP